MRQRDYRKEYDSYHAKPEQRRRNDARKKARRLMVSKGRVQKGDGREVDHKDFNPRNNALANLRITSRRTNRRRQP